MICVLLLAFDELVAHQVFIYRLAVRHVKIYLLFGTEASQSITIIKGSYNVTLEDSLLAVDNLFDV